MKSSSVGSKAPACAGAATKKVQADPQAVLQPAKEAGSQLTGVRHTCLKAGCSRWKENKCRLAGMLSDADDHVMQ